MAVVAPTNRNPAVAAASKKAAAPVFSKSKSKAKPQARTNPTLVRVAFVVVVVGLVYLIYARQTSKPAVDSDAGSQLTAGQDSTEDTGTPTPVQPTPKALVRTAYVAPEDPALANALSGLRVNVEAGSPVEAFQAILDALKSNQAPLQESAYKHLAAQDPKNMASLILAALPTADAFQLPWLAKACQQFKLAGAALPLLDRWKSLGSDAPPEMLEVIGVYGGASAHRAALEMLRNVDLVRQREGWQVLVFCAAPSDCEMLLGALERGTPQDAHFATLALGKLAESKPEILAAVVDVYRKALHTTEKAWRVRAAQGVSALPDGNATEDLLDELSTDSDLDVRKIALERLVHTSNSERYLLKAVEDGQPKPILEMALLELKAAPNFRIVNRLVEILKWHDPVLSRRAYEALVAAFNLDLGTHATAWEVWLQSGSGEKDAGRWIVFQNARAGR